MVSKKHDTTAQTAKDPGGDTVQRGNSISHRTVTFGGIGAFHAFFSCYFIIIFWLWFVCHGNCVQYIPIRSTGVLLSVQYPVTSSPTHVFLRPWPFAIRKQGSWSLLSLMMDVRSPTSLSSLDGHSHTFVPNSHYFARSCLQEREWILSFLFLDELR